MESPSLRNTMDKLEEEKNDIKDVFEQLVNEIHDGLRSLSVKINIQNRLEEIFKTHEINENSMGICSIQKRGESNNRFISLMEKTYEVNINAHEKMYMLDIHADALSDLNEKGFELQDILCVNNLDVSKAYTIEYQNGDAPRFFLHTQGYEKKTGSKYIRINPKNKSMNYQEKNLDISRHVPETFKLFISKEGVGIFALDKSNSEIHNEVQMNFYSYAGF